MEKIYSMDEIQLDDLDSIIGGNNESYSNINGTINISICNRLLLNILQVISQKYGLNL